MTLAGIRLPMSKYGLRGTRRSQFAAFSRHNSTTNRLCTRLLLIFPTSIFQAQPPVAIVREIG